MPIRIGINGFGRIGKIAARIISANPVKYKIACINVRNADLDYMAYMLKYDSTFGRFNGDVGTYENGLVINGEKVPVTAESDAKNAGWGEYGADYIIEATGAYLTSEKSSLHLGAGAKKVVLSAPAKDAQIPTFVYGVNHQKYRSDMDIVSAASCTTNCISPVCKVLADNFGIESGLMSTIHSATAKQKVVDSRVDKDWRVGRSTFGNIIPTTTGVAKAFDLVFPELAGRVSGVAYRVPTADVSLVDFNVMLERKTSLPEICQKMKEASEANLKDVLFYSTDKTVSTDFLGCPAASVFDATMGIQISDRFFKLIAYYDNEWGYTSNLLRLISYMNNADSEDRVSRAFR